LVAPLIVFYYLLMILYRVILDYDFNKGFDYEVTVEEAIMMQLTNDLGQQVLPHVAHIMITEFRKFMFLVGEHIREVESKEEGGCIY